MSKTISEIFSTEFVATFERMRKLSGKSVREVAWLGGVDYAYLNRLLTGEKSNPSAETLMKIWIGLIFDMALVNKDPLMTEGLAELSQAATITMGSRQLMDKLFGE